MANKKTAAHKLDSIEKNIREIDRKISGSRTQNNGYKTPLFDEKTSFGKTFAASSHDVLLDKMNDFVEKFPRSVLGNLGGIVDFWEKGYQRQIAQHQHLMEKSERERSNISSKMVAMKVHGNVFLSVSGNAFAVGAGEKKHLLRTGDQKAAKGSKLRRDGVATTLAQPGGKTQIELPFISDVTVFLALIKEIDELPKEIRDAGQMFNKLIGTHFGGKADARKSGRLTKEERKDLGKGMAEALKEQEKRRNLPWWKGGLNPLRDMPMKIEQGMYSAFPSLPRGLGSAKDIGKYLDPEDKFGLLKMPDFRGTKKEQQLKRARFRSFGKKFYADFASNEINPKTGRMIRAEAAERYKKFRESDFGKEAGLDKLKDPLRGMTKTGEDGKLEMKLFSTRNLLKLGMMVGGRSALGAMYLPVAGSIMAVTKVVKKIGDMIPSWEGTKGFMRSAKDKVVGGAKAVGKGLIWTKDLLMKAAGAFLPMLSSVIPMLVNALPWAMLVGLTVVGAKKAWDVGKILGDALGDWWSKKDLSEDKLKADQMVSGVLANEFGSTMSPERIARAKELNNMDLDDLQDTYKSVTGKSDVAAAYLPEKAVPTDIQNRGGAGVAISRTTPTEQKTSEVVQKPQMNLITQAPTTNNQMNSYTTVDMSFNHARNSMDEMYGGSGW